MSLLRSKDILDDADAVPPPPMPPSAPASQVAPPPARPGSAAGMRPGTATSTRSGLEEEQAEDLSTPASAAALRQKFLQNQQRQKTLQKQRTAGAGMVQANQGMLMSSSPMSSTSSAAKPTLGRSMSSVSSATSPTADAPPPPPPPPPSAAAAGYGGGEAPPPAPAPVMTRCAGDTGGSFSSPKAPEGELNNKKSPANAQLAMNKAKHEEDDIVQALKTWMPDKEAIPFWFLDDLEGMVAPTDLSPDELKAEETRRRNSLAATLDEKGISAVFDPGSSGNGGASPKPQFDVTTVPGNEMKQFLLNPAPKSAGMIECRIIRT
ncbi:hypothetical protein AK812_SmicGene23603 [Symbiodinium microadriaticum]|uniref:Uncharacterized protein n=1 Tax=Symbiodinium microadriaticum TaxID=2951 RepID=A0A1Q9DGR1_SYMMI|nr:hypothetical protein AK812_SmicGene23603 [Symbiodinium microadriaticum]